MSPFIFSIAKGLHIKYRVCRVLNFACQYSYTVVILTLTGENYTKIEIIMRTYTLFLGCKLQKCVVDYA